MEYNSSESVQRQNIDVFTGGASGKKPANLTEKNKLKKMLDFYIDRHSKTTAVRAMAKESNRGVEYQLDLSADIVELLEKIKKELR